jgi:2-oxoglutarate ferredoxin oxidoreductase subunit delta
VFFCPQEVLGLDENEKAVVLNPEDCIACGMCELRCPDMAIEVEAL